ncbi:MAG: mechanosensitive ion channel family protein [Candidatus Eiseniibacteriota bacterium]
MMLAANLMKSMLPDAEHLWQIGLRIGIAIVIAFVVQRLLYLIWGRVARFLVRTADDERAAKQRVSTVTMVIRNTITIVVTLFALIYALESLGWDVKPLLAGAGIVGVALGFGAQSLVRDWIAGVFILTENQFGVGDIIEINGKAATVEIIQLRSTRLRDFQGYVYFVPNGEFKLVINRTRGWNRLAVDVRVRTGQDLDRVLERCREVARDMSADPAWQDRLLEPVQVMGIERLGSDAMVRLAVRTLPGSHSADAARELRRRLHQGLAASGIEYPVVTLAAGSESESTL